jgi:methylenetetrahydrofolate dehydrogenase (NADP+)/methenyltetrahydrofolate cyclohydrolase
MIILSGTPVRDRIKDEIIHSLPTLSRDPKLLIIQVGNNPESSVYVSQKMKFGQSVGISVEHMVCDENISEQDLLSRIHTSNTSQEVTGIIIQLPLPPHLNTRTILDAVDPAKDVDGLGITQIGLRTVGDQYAHVPATARGIMSLYDHYSISLEGKHVVVVGRSQLVGKPVASLCLQRNATVTVCHSHTVGLENITRTADILVIACGKPRLITASHVVPGQIVIDVGLHRTDSGLCGDVDYDEVARVVSAITPVPGGVGPLTVASLFQNVVDAVRFLK